MQARNSISVPASATAGLTIIEVLVSIALLSVIVLVVLTPLIGFFGLTRRSNDQVSATQTAQRAMESLRGDWLDLSRYDKNCLVHPDVLEGLAVEVTALDVDNRSTGTLGQPGNCALAGAGGDPPPLKRIRITLSGPQDRVLADLSVVVDRP